MKAFPKLKEITEKEYQAGMDLRDYFAAKALQGMIHMFQPDDFFNPERVTKVAYQIADSMMEIRKAQEKC